MKRSFLLLFFLIIGIETFAQQYDFIPNDLKPVPIAELKKPDGPLDLVFYEDGTKVTFKEAMEKVQNEEVIPLMFADKSGRYKALVISEKIQIDYPGIPNSLKELGYSFGNPESDFVVIYSQGGPFPKLSSWKWQKWMLSLNEEFGSYFFINSMQTQIINSDEYSQKEISFDEAKTYIESTTEILEDLVKYFKSQNKKVYLYGISHGAFIVENLIATKGNIADGYLAMVGRLDMDDEMWRSRANNGRARFLDDGKTIVQTEVDSTIIGRNQDKLHAAKAYKRYTELLKGINLSNMIYLYAKLDQKVGSLTKKEIEFLESAGAKVIASEGNHSSYQPYLETLMKQLIKN